jgi:immunity protein 50 of polymorphic toxin system
MPVTREVASSSLVDPAKISLTTHAKFCPAVAPEWCEGGPSLTQSTRNFVPESSWLIGPHWPIGNTVSFENSALLESIFGRWPSFHDAEVLRVVLDRSGDEGPTLEAAIHVFEMTPDVDPKGYYVLKNHTEVTSAFPLIVRTSGLPVFLRRSSSSDVLRLKSLRDRMSLAMSSIDASSNSHRI